MHTFVCNSYMYSFSALLFLRISALLSATRRLKYGTKADLDKLPTQTTPKPSGQLQLTVGVRCRIAS
jgi:hypothetical protein